MPIPALTEERRKEIVKRLHHVAEDHRVALRNIRRDANEHLKKLLKDKAISEDEERRALDEVQKMTDGYIRQDGPGVEGQRKRDSGDQVGRLWRFLSRLCVPARCSNSFDLTKGLSPHLTTRRGTGPLNNPRTAEDSSIDDGAKFPRTGAPTWPGADEGPGLLRLKGKSHACETASDKSGKLLSHRQI